MSVPDPLIAGCAYRIDGDPSFWRGVLIQCVDCTNAPWPVPTDRFGWRSFFVGRGYVAAVESGLAVVVITLNAGRITVESNDAEAGTLIRARIEAWRLTPATDEITEH
jgi:hypothetical protein